MTHDLVSMAILGLCFLVPLSQAHTIKMQVSPDSALKSGVKESWEAILPHSMFSCARFTEAPDPEKPRKIPSTLPLLNKFDGKEQDRIKRWAICTLKKLDALEKAKPQSSPGLISWLKNAFRSPFHPYQMEILMHDKGSQGSVFPGTWTESLTNPSETRKAMIKKMSKKQVGLSQVLNEARTMVVAYALVPHRVPRLYDVDINSNSNSYKLIMEPSHQNLFVHLRKNYFDKGKFLSESTVRSYILPMIKLLRTLNDAGIIHRDVKPENILCDLTETSDCRTKLTDFGLSLLNVKPNPSEGHAGTIMYIPRPLFFKLNQKDRERFTDTVDVYAIVCIIHDAFSLLGENGLNEKSGFFRRNWKNFPHLHPISPQIRTIFSKVLDMKEWSRNPLTFKELEADFKAWEEAQLD